jgi:hypothetical protein
MANYKNIKNEYDIIWDSTIQSTNFTAESTQGYFIDTSSAVVTMTLPASPGAGDFVAVKDYARSFGTNKLVIAGNGSNIQGNASPSELDQTGDTAVLVYIDSTKGWLYTQENTVPELPSAEYIVASGGTETTCGDYKIHTFNSSGTFTVTQAGNACGSNTVDYMVIAGGAAGGTYYGGGGGGAGGFRESVPNPAAWTASPIANPGGALPVSVQGYPVTVGGGGPPRSAPEGDYSPGDAGSPSTFSTITSAGGGGGNCVNNPTFPGGSGGSGGGLFGCNSTRSGGTGNSPPTSPPQGNPGGTMRAPVPEPGKIGSGGGGATAAGALGGGPAPLGGPGAGGAGATTSITGSPVAYAGGGGGGGAPSQPLFGPGGTGGGGNGSTGPSNNAQAGATNKGGGGGGGGPNSSGAGGSGKVVIRYKFQN